MKRKFKICEKCYYFRQINYENIYRLFWFFESRQHIEWYRCFKRGNPVSSKEGYEALDLPSICNYEFEYLVLNNEKH